MRLLPKDPPFLVTLYAELSGRDQHGRMWVDSIDGRLFLTVRAARRWLDGQRRAGWHVQHSAIWRGNSLRDASHEGSLA